MKLNFKINISFNNFLAIGLYGFSCFFTGIFYDFFWPGLIFLIPLYFLMIKILFYWEVKVDNYQLYFTRFFIVKKGIPINQFESYNVKKVFFISRFALKFKDGSIFKFIATPSVLIKEYCDGTVSNLLDEILENNAIQNEK